MYLDKFQVLKCEFLVISSGRLLQPATPELTLPNLGRSKWVLAQDIELLLEQDTLFN